MAKKERISLSEAARRAGVSKKTLTRWADEKIVPVRKGKWTAQAAAQAAVDAANPSSPAATHCSTINPPDG